MKTALRLGKLAAITVVATLVIVPLVGAQAIVTGFPDSDAGSGRFVNLTRGLASLGPDETRFGIIVRPVAQFRLGVFDGNMSGRWDAWSPMTATPDESIFTLYADPLGTGSQATMVGQWSGGSMPDAGWFETTVGNVEAARMTSGNYGYNLVVSWTTPGLANEQNNFKILVEGQLLAPGGGGTYGFIGYTPNDPDPAKFSPSSYDGSWHFHLLVTPGTSAINLWNGDFDRADDAIDANSPTVPPFPYPAITQPEGIWPGVPADDAALTSPLLVPPAVFQWLGNLAGTLQSVDSNPSGNREWEVFRVGLAGTDPDVEVSSLPAGQYEWTIEGADGRNTLFVATDSVFYAELPGKIGDFVWLDCSDDSSHSVGIQCTDPCREGIPNVELELWLDGDGNGEVETKIRSTITDANGYYLFDDVLPGFYETRVVPGTLPPGLLPIYDYDGIATAHVAEVTLGVAEINLELDFGYDERPSQQLQGCTPGYWKQWQHFDSWVGYSQNTKYNKVFSVPYVKSLLQALVAGGSGQKALGRHAVAALLNSTNSHVNYYYSTAEVISLVQQAYASGQYESIKNLLERQNEAGCPLN